MLGKKIQECRKEKNISQEGLSELIGVSRQAISRWELDDALPTLENCIELCKVFEVTMDELLGLETSQKKQTSIALSTYKKISTLLIVVSILLNLTCFWLFSERNQWKTENENMKIAFEEYEQDKRNNHQQYEYFINEYTVEYDNINTVSNTADLIFTAKIYTMQKDFVVLVVIEGENETYTAEAIMVDTNTYKAIIPMSMENNINIFVNRIIGNNIKTYPLEYQKEFLSN